MSLEPLLQVSAIRKSFGNAEVLRGISLSIARGEFVTMLGESGSGKTTLLRLIAGFETADSGTIQIGGKSLLGLPPNRRPVNTVFQSYALFPHFSVFENVAYGLRTAGVARSELEQRTDQALQLVQMAGFAKRAPASLSGGQQQRVALARALVNRPEILLLDEPLSALDANLRHAMQLELKALQREIGITFLFVTHDQDEAALVSDRIALLRNGVLEQIASPEALYDCPRTAYAAKFFGQTNLLRGTVSRGEVRCGQMEWPCNAQDGPATFSLRPENIRSAFSSEESLVRFHSTVTAKAFSRGLTYLTVMCRDGQELLVRTTGSQNTMGETEFAFCPSKAIKVEE